MSNVRNKVRSTSPVTEVEVIKYLNDYFKNFEINLEKHDFAAMNTQLPLVIIEKFHKLFRLWNTNRILERSIKKELFQEIHTTMSTEFDDASSNSSDRSSVISADSFFLECRRCGEEIEMRNNNCKYSYEFHKTTSEHLEFIKGVESPLEYSPIVRQESDFEINPYDRFFIYSRCNLCYVQIAPNSSPDEAVILHLLSPFHKERRVIFQANEKYIELVNYKENLFRCLLCDENYYLDRMVFHCNSHQHKEKISSLPIVTEEIMLPIEEKLLFKQYIKAVESLSVKERLGNQFAAQKENNKTSDGADSSAADAVLISEFDKECMVFVDGVIRCRLCCCKLITLKFFISHMTGCPHKKAKKKLGRSIKYIERIDENNLRCTLCNISNTRLDLFFKHCKKSTHKEKLRSIILDCKAKPEEESLVDAMTTKLKCPICQQLIFGAKEMFEHLKVDHSYAL